MAYYNLSGNQYAIRDHWLSWLLHDLEIANHTGRLSNSNKDSVNLKPIKQNLKKPLASADFVNKVIFFVGFKGVSDYT